MTQEEKAKAYDEALERAKSWAKGEHPECFSEAQKAVEFIFPELKESEDEKIRKAIIRILKGETSYTSKEDADKYVAWLEKQGASNTFKASETSIKDAEEEVRQYLSGSGNEKHIAEFMRRYADWNRQREEWDRSLLDALIQRGR